MRVAIRDLASSGEAQRVKQAVFGSWRLCCRCWFPSRGLDLGGLVRPLRLGVPWRKVRKGIIRKRLWTVSILNSTHYKGKGALTRKVQPSPWERRTKVRSISTRSKNKVRFKEDYICAWSGDDPAMKIKIYNQTIYFKDQCQEHTTVGYGSDSPGGGLNVTL